ncbi:hypothetical protein PR048_014509 [Dryococelus australis]|uniref:Polyprotein n=1 Tax=Dryococelus australis TaxID=614101 RepID=A0ABQ9HEN1_9NEOP|nr:hypothetical protein PR048_014509 [Dryococelus australis]
MIGNKVCLVSLRIGAARLHELYVPLIGSAACGTQCGMFDSKSVNKPRLKAVHDKVSTLEMNLRKKSLSLATHILTGALSDMHPVKLVTMDGKAATAALVEKQSREMLELINEKRSEYMMAESLYLDDMDAYSQDVLPYPSQAPLPARARPLQVPGLQRPHRVLRHRPDRHLRSISYDPDRHFLAQLSYRARSKDKIQRLPLQYPHILKLYTKVAQEDQKTFTDLVRQLVGRCTSDIEKASNMRMEQRRNERTGETGDPRDNPPTSGIIRQDSHTRKSGSGPARNKIRSRWPVKGATTTNPPIRESTVEMLFNKSGRLRKIPVMLNVHGHGGPVARALIPLSPQQGELGSILGGVAPGFDHAGIVPDDATGVRLFLVTSPPPHRGNCCIQALQSYMLTAAQIFPLLSTLVAPVIKSTRSYETMLNHVKNTFVVLRTVSTTIFRWITVKNLNTMQFDDNLRGDTPMGLLRGIKHGTESYHVLFKRLCSCFGIIRKGALYAPCEISAVFKYIPTYLQLEEDIRDCLPCKECFEGYTTSVSDTPHHRGWCKARRAALEAPTPVQGLYTQAVPTEDVPMTPDSVQIFYAEATPPEDVPTSPDSVQSFYAQAIPPKDGLATPALPVEDPVQVFHWQAMPGDEESNPEHSKHLDRTTQRAYRLQMHGIRWADGNIPYGDIRQVLEQAIILNYLVYVDHQESAMCNVCPVRTNVVDLHRPLQKSPLACSSRRLSSVDACRPGDFRVVSKVCAEHLGRCELPVSFAQAAAGEICTPRRTVFTPVKH